MSVEKDQQSLAEISSHEHAALVAEIRYDEAVRQVITHIGDVAASQASLRIYELVPELPAEPEEEPSILEQTALQAEQGLQDAIATAIHNRREQLVRNFQAQYAREVLIQDV